MFPPVHFEGFDEFEHFSDPDHADCFVCNSRLMQVRPVVVTDDYVLLPATMRLDDGSFVVIPDAWGLYPRKHVTKRSEMPRDWMLSIQIAAWTLGFTDDTPSCDSTNWTPDAGQTIPHAHTWLIKRGDGEEGLLCHRLGLAGIIIRLKKRGYGWPH
jgi:hypothetical protein